MEDNIQKIEEDGGHEKEDVVGQNNEEKEKGDAELRRLADHHKKEIQRTIEESINRMHR